MTKIDENAVSKIRRWFLYSGIAGLIILVFAGIVGFLALMQTTEPARQAFVRTQAIAAQIVRAQNLLQLSGDMGEAQRVGDLFRIRNELTSTLADFEVGHLDLIRGSTELGLTPIEEPEQSAILSGTAESLEISIGDVARTLRNDFLADVAVPSAQIVEAVRNRIRYDINPKLARLEELNAGSSTLVMNFLLAAQLTTGASFALAGLLIWLLVHGRLASRTYALIKPETSDEEERILRTVDPYSNLPNEEYLIERIVEHRDLHWRQEGLSVLVLMNLENIDAFYAKNDRTRRAAVQRGIIRRLNLLVRAGDAVTITSQNSFAILAGPLPGREDIEPVLNAILDVFSVPHHFDGEQADLSPSIGVTTVTRNTRNPAQPIAEAGAAASLAHSAGLGPLVGFHSHIARYPDHAEGLKQDIKEALETNDVQVLFDPIWDSNTGALHRLTAVPTMTHKILGPLLPTEFEQMAWATGNGKALLRRVTTESLSLAMKAQQAGTMSNQCLIRVPAMAITEPGLLDSFKWAADKANAPLKNVAMHLTGAVNGLLESSEVTAALPL